MNHSLTRSLLILMAIMSLVGCRGYRSEKTPIHMNPNMDIQAKHKAQSFSQAPPEHTVAWGDRLAFAFPNSKFSI